MDKNDEKAREIADNICIDWVGTGSQRSAKLDEKADLAYIAQTLRDTATEERERCARIAEMYWLEDADEEPAECSAHIAAAIRAGESDG